MTNSRENFPCFRCSFSYCKSMSSIRSAYLILSYQDNQRRTHSNLSMGDLFRPVYALNNTSCITDEITKLTVNVRQTVLKFHVFSRILLYYAFLQRQRWPVRSNQWFFSSEYVLNGKVRRLAKDIQVPEPDSDELVNKNVLDKENSITKD